jgi:hypothetical protein
MPYHIRAVVILMFSIFDQLAILVHGIGIIEILGWTIQKNMPVIPPGWNISPFCTGGIQIQIFPQIGCTVARFFQPGCNGLLFIFLFIKGCKPRRIFKDPCIVWILTAQDRGS